MNLLFFPQHSSIYYCFPTQTMNSVFSPFLFTAVQSIYVFLQHNPICNYFLRHTQSVVNFFTTGQSITYYYYQHTQTITIFLNAPSLLLFLISTNNLSLTSKQSFLNYLLNAFCITTEDDRSIITSLTQPMYLYSLQDARTWERCIECAATK